MIALQNFASQYDGNTQCREVAGAHLIHCRLAVIVFSWRVAFHLNPRNGISSAEHTQVRKTHRLHSRDPLELSGQLT